MRWNTKQIYEGMVGGRQLSQGRFYPSEHLPEDTLQQIKSNLPIGNLHKNKVNPKPSPLTHESN